jgi:hypothetical protein
VCGYYRAATDAEHAANHDAAVALARAVAGRDYAGAWMLLREYADPARGGELLDLAEWLTMLAGELAAAIVDGAGMPEPQFWADVEGALAGMPEAMAAHDGG